MSDTETKTIGGKCEEISEKNGWTSFAINVGSTYPVRLSTKLPALIEQGRAVGNEYAFWTFKESQGGENPNKPGTFYTNRYFESVTTEATASDSEGAQTTSVTHTRQGSTWTAGGSTQDETRGSIERQTIVKAAIGLYPVELKTDAEFFALLLRLEAFCSGSFAVPEVASDDGIPFD